jgi:hypothetical protein
MIEAITSSEFRIQLIGGNPVTFPYDNKYAHMRKYEIIWVYIYHGVVTELHTLECVERKSKVRHRPPPMSLEMLEVEAGDCFEEGIVW